jgi:hypothetical protein
MAPAIPISELWANPSVVGKVQKRKAMVDPEVSRLRRLRAMALRLRAIACTLRSKPYASNEVLLERAAGAGWRIARAVSGRLRAHPYASYQQDAGLGRRLCDGLFANFLALGISTRAQALAKTECHLGALARQLADVRALTWSPDLSESLGRSQFELNQLFDALARETPGTSGSMCLLHGGAVAANGAGGFAGAIVGDWPYLAF